MEENIVRARVRQDYGRVAEEADEGCGCSCGGGCCGANDLRAAADKLGYSADQLDSIPEGAYLGLGCGNPLAALALEEGQTILDLGSGAGVDCFLAREHVGDSGLVIGVDMTPEMVELARKNAAQKGYTNVDFRLGEIEHLPVADDSVDVIISNCVINLSPDKEQVFKEAYRVLKSGGKLCISDVVATADVPEDVKADLALVSGCIAGAAGVDEIRAMLERTGFQEIRMVAKDNSAEIIGEWALGEQATEFLASYIIEARKN